MARCVSISCVLILNPALLDHFLSGNRRARLAIHNWIARVREHRWRTPYDARLRMPGMRRLPSRTYRGNLLIFGIMQNEFRIIADADYENGTLTIVFVGNHAGYERMLKRLR